MNEGEPMEGMEYQEIFSEFRNEIDKYKNDLAYYDQQIKWGEERMVRAEADMREYAADEVLYGHILDNYETVKFLHEENIKMRKKVVTAIEHLERVDKALAKMALGAKRDELN